MRCVALGGMPGTGKTRIMRDLIKCLTAEHTSIWAGAYKTFKYRHLKKPNVIVAGIYDGKVNDGTDRLSMAVMPDAKAFVENHLGSDLTVVFEGDRLFTKNFLEWLAGKVSDYYFLILTATDDVRAKRYLERGTNQSEKFIKGRATKYANIMYSNLRVEPIQNNDVLDTGIIVAKLLNYIQDG